MATVEQALQLVQLLEAELIRRSPDITRHNAYYQGEHPLKYASAEFASSTGTATRTSPTTGRRLWATPRWNV